MSGSGPAALAGVAASPWSRLLARAFLVWLLVLVAAFLNGAVRELLLAPLFGQSRAHLLSAAILIAVLLLAAGWLVKRTRPRRPVGQWFLVGAFWAVLTVVFEFLFFHYVAGMPWHQLAAAFDPRQGGYFGLIALAMLLAPPGMAWLLRR